MIYKATVSFAGVLTMDEGEKRNLTEKEAAPFVKCGFLVVEKPEKKQK